MHSNFSFKLSEEELINKAYEIRDENTAYFDDYNNELDESYEEILSENYDEKSSENFDGKSVENYNEKTVENYDKKPAENYDNDVETIDRVDITEEPSNDENIYDDNLDDYDYNDISILGIAIRQIYNSFFNL